MDISKHISGKYMETALNQMAIQELKNKIFEIKEAIFRRKVSIKLVRQVNINFQTQTDSFLFEKNNRASVICQIISRSLTY